MKYLLIALITAFSISLNAQTGAFQQLNIQKKLTLSGYVLKGVVSDMMDDSLSTDKVPTVGAVADWVRMHGGLGDGVVNPYPNLTGNTFIGGNYVLSFNNSETQFNSSATFYNGASFYTYPLGLPKLTATPGFTDNGYIWYDEATGKLKGKESNIVKDIIFSGVTSAATPGYIPKMTGANTLGNSILQESNGGFVMGGAFDNLGPYATPPVIGAGANFFWYPSKAAVRMGSNFSGGQYVASEIGLNSFGSSSSTSKGDRSFSWGAGRAYGSDATAFNFGVALGHLSTAYGNNTTAQGYAQFVVGELNDFAGIPLHSGDQTSPLFTVGNGYVDLIQPYFHFRNAFQVLRNGTIQLGTKYRNNVLLDSALTVDVNGNLKLKYFSTSNGPGISSWGELTGSINDQFDLMNQFSKKANTEHNHNIADVSNLQFSLDQKVNVLGAYVDPSFIQKLDWSKILNTPVIPTLAQMNGLIADSLKKGDTVRIGPSLMVISFNNRDSILLVGDLDNVPAGYYYGTAPGSTDRTFNALNPAAVGLYNVDNTSDMSKPLSTAAIEAFSGTVPGMRTITINGVSHSLEDDVAFTVSGTGSASSGSHVPALTNSANTSSRTAYKSIYTQVDSIIDINGSVSGAVTDSSGTYTELLISIPVSSDFTDASDASGFGSSQALSAGSATDITISADAVTDKVKLSFAAQKTNFNIKYSFKYLVKAPSTPTPTITTSVGSVTGVTAVEGSASGSYSYNYSASNLTDSLIVTAGTNLQVSQDNATWVSRFAKYPISGAVSSANLWLRSSNTAPAGALSSSIVITSSGAVSKTTTVSGTISGLVAVTDTIYSDTARFATGGTALSVGGWADLSPTGAPHSSVKSATQGGYTLSTNTTGAWHVYGGTTYNTAGGATVNDGGGYAFNSSVQGSVLYNWGSTYSTTADANFKISGLTPDSVYVIELLPTSGGVAVAGTAAKLIDRDGVTAYTTYMNGTRNVNANNSTTSGVYATGNTSKFFRMWGRANASGIIYIYIGGTDNVSDPTRFGIAAGIRMYAAHISTH